MGFREYFQNSTHATRWKWCAFLAVLFHAMVLAGSSWVMTQRAQYGMAGAMAGDGLPRVAPIPAEDAVELDTAEDDAPVEHRKKTRALPAGVGGPKSSGARELASYYRNPPPLYPETARQMKEEGRVVLHAEIDSQGRVVSVSVKTSSGFSDLDESALETVRAQWQFKPAQIAGIPIATSVNIPVNFCLKDAR